MHSIFKMKKCAIFWNICISILLLCIISSSSAEAVDPITIGMAVLKVGSTAAQFLWNLQDLSVLQNITLVQIRERLVNVETYLESVASETVYKGRFEEIISGMSENAIKIDTHYNTTVNYLRLSRKKKNKLSDAEKNTIIDFASEIFKVGDDKPFGRYNTLYTNVKTQLLPALKSLTGLLQKGYKFTCVKFEHQLQSLQQNLVMLLKTVKMAEIKVFLILKASSKLMNLHGGGSYKNLVREKIDTMTVWFADILNMFREIISEASQDLWRCDPNMHKQETTYVQLNNVFQKYIVNEKNIHESCGRTCDFDNVSQNKTCHIFSPESVCQHSPRCQGNLHDCTSAFNKLHVAITGEIDICLAPKAENRRYDMISERTLYFTKTKQKFGPREECGEGQMLATERRYHMKNKLVGYCEICLCTCDENRGYLDPRKHKTTETTDRFFYTKGIFSKLEDNFVITGARLVKSNSVVYIQIQQGKLLEEGVIDQSSVVWKEEYEDDLYDHQYHVELEWPKRSIELQDINIPAGHVLIGLQFIRSSSDRLKLQLFSVPFDFNSGVIVDPYMDPIPSEGDPISTGKDLEDLNLPEFGLESSEVLINQYVNFSTSNFISDLGQTTIPFLDIQNVETNVAIPMEGAGLYYKYRPGNAGFLGIKLKTYNISRHMAHYDDEKQVNFKVFSLAEGRIGVFAE